MKGEKCLLFEYCEKYAKPETVDVLDCQYKSGQELCFKGLVFDVGQDVIERTRTIERLREVRRGLEEARVSGNYFSDGTK